MVLASQAQHGMWITERVHGTGTAYHMPFALWFDGPLDREAMLAACASVVARHPVLSCVFEERDGELHLVPAAAKPPVEFLPSVPDPEAFVEREIARPFDLERGPLARFTLAGVSPERHLLLFVAHHLVFDGMSKDVLVRDLAAAYTGGPLSPLPLPYGGSGEVPAEAAAYWRERWREVPSVVVGGVPRAPRVAGRGETVLFDLTREMAAAAFDGVSRFELFLSAVHALLFRYGNAEVSVAVALSTRTPETRDHIGLFATELPVFSAPEPDLAFRDLALRLRAEMRRLNAFREVPVARAVGGIRPRPALAPASISFRRRAADRDFPGLRVSAEWKMSNHVVRNALHFQAVDGDDGLHVTLHHSPEIVSREEAERVAAHLRAVLEAVAADPGVRLAALPLPEAAVVTASPGASPSESPRSGAAVDGELVGQVRGIWMEVLRLDDIAPDEDLYDLGGHSLTITQICARIRKRLGVDVPFDVFLDDPTIAGVAAAVGELRA
ncbi:condensation domain-containing protein [Nonomuraea roseoviolacea subsp. roseoviolacea]|uniref:condensation domain-containing protein n=1 Tax=Nonomuraea roseoviolacea TaxID=103837 RepID=UPI0031DB8433